MEKVNFTPLDLSKLSNEDVAALVSKTIDNANSVTASIGVVPNAILAIMQPKNEAFAAQVNRLRKSVLTSPINNQRSKCDDSFAEIKRTTTFHSKSRDTHKKDAAEVISYFLAPYKDLTKKSLATQQESTDEMIEKFSNNAAIIDAATTLDIKDLFDQLKADNLELKQLFDQRNLEVGSRTEPSSELRAPAADAYREFCISIEQSATYAPNQDISNLFIQMEELRKKYHALIPKEEIITDDEADEVDPEM